MRYGKFAKTALAALVAGLALTSAPSQAAVLSFEDDNIDFLLNADGTAKTTGTFATGDILVSIFEITAYTIDGANAIPDGQELTGVAAVRLTGGDGSLATPWTFSYTHQGLNTWSDTDVVGGGGDEGATVAMFLNSTASNLDLNFASNPAGSCASLAACITAATLGTLVQVDGFTNVGGAPGDLDEFWRSVATVVGGGDVDVVGGASGDLAVASVQAAQTTLYNKDGTVTFRNILSGLPCPAGTVALDGCIQGPVLTGPILGGSGLNAGIVADGAFARSDFDASKLTVPEPGSLALLGLALGGLAFFGGKKRVA